MPVAMFYCLDTDNFTRYVLFSVALNNSESHLLCIITIHTRILNSGE